MCTTPVCHPNCSKVHGKCIRPNTCACDIGWEVITNQYLYWLRQNNNKHMIFIQNIKQDCLNYHFNRVRTVRNVFHYPDAKMGIVKRRLIANVKRDGRVLIAKRVRQYFFQNVNECCIISYFSLNIRCTMLCIFFIQLYAGRGVVNMDIVIVLGNAGKHINIKDCIITSN